MENKEMICVGCPLGCHIVLTIDESETIVKFEGNECRVGEKYVVQEFKAPVRVFTGTVRTKDSSRPLLSVRTKTPIAKENILKCGTYLYGVEVAPPIKNGDVLVQNILNTGADLIATSNLD